ncbi:uncharacterized protein LOC126471457 [Schistocerca serialis cubense]|uniref:uncharacterized protein LOC126471457 n=1 Tax=Schistocerca serialis cubense TaxID=2023355 RepID=UPI00214E4066|nr:uncharacterized protein LOC126471457 [Schistocerca serialis cubense]
MITMKVRHSGKWARSKMNAANYREPQKSLGREGVELPSSLLDNIKGRDILLSLCKQIGRVLKGTRGYSVNKLACQFHQLKSIKHMWDALGRCIAACLCAPVTIQELSTMLVKEWNALPQEFLSNLVASMGPHYETFIVTHGDHTLH